MMILASALAVAAVPTQPAPRDLVLPRQKVEHACTAAVVAARAGAGPAVGVPQTTKEKEVLLLSAVDKRVGGCRVLVMAANSTDIRPEPAPATGGAQLLRRPY